jgi:hypothetical protein
LASLGTAPLIKVDKKHLLLYYAHLIIFSNQEYNFMTSPITATTAIKTTAVPQSQAEIANNTILLALKEYLNYPGNKRIFEVLTDDHPSANPSSPTLTWITSNDWLQVVKEKHWGSNEYSKFMKQGVDSGIDSIMTPMMKNGEARFDAIVIYNPDFKGRLNARLFDLFFPLRDKLNPSGYLIIYFTPDTNCSIETITQDSEHFRLHLIEQRKEGIANTLFVFQKKPILWTLPCTDEGCKKDHRLVSDKKVHISKEITECDWAVITEEVNDRQNEWHKVTAKIKVPRTFSKEYLTVDYKRQISHAALSKERKRDCILENQSAFPRVLTEIIADYLNYRIEIIENLSLYILLGMPDPSESEINAARPKEPVVEL